MTNILPNIKDRVLYIADFKGYGKKNFCEKIGMTYSNFTGKAKNTPLNSEAIGNILTIMPDVSAEWLITGRGEMLKKTTDSSNDSSLTEGQFKYFVDKVEAQAKEIGRLESELEKIKKD